MTLKIAQEAISSMVTCDLILTKPNTFHVYLSVHMCLCVSLLWRPEVQSVFLRLSPPYVLWQDLPLSLKLAADQAPQVVLSVEPWSFGHTLKSLHFLPAGSGASNSCSRHFVAGTISPNSSKPFKSRAFIKFPNVLAQHSGA